MPVATLARVAASEVFFGQAIRAFAQGDAVRAEADINRAKAIRPDPRYQLGLAQVKAVAFATSKDASGAVAALKAAAAESIRDPAYWIALMGAAAPVAQSGDKNAAAVLTDAADHAVAIAPAHPVALLLAGDAYALAGDKDGAGARYARAASLKPDYADAFLRMAQLAVDAKDLTTARDLALQAVRSAPANRAAMAGFVNISITRNAPGDADAAVAAILGYLQAVPDDAGVIGTLGQLLERAGRPADAKQTYLRLKQVAPDTAGLDDRIRAMDAAIASSSASSTPAAKK